MWFLIILPNTGFSFELCFWKKLLEPGRDHIIRSYSVEEQVGPSSKAWDA